VTQPSVILCYRDDLPEVTAQLVDRNYHVLIQNRRSDIAHLFADQTNVLLVEFQDELVAVSDWTRRGIMWHTYVFSNLQLQLPRECQ